MSGFKEKKMKGMADWRVSVVCLMMCLLRTQWEMEMPPFPLLFILVQREYEYVSCDYEGKHQRTDDPLISGLAAMTLNSTHIYVYWNKKADQRMSAYMDSWIRLINLYDSQLCFNVALKSLC